MLQLEEMHDPEVNSSDRCRVIVDQPHPAEPSRARDFNLLVELAPHRRFIGIETLSPLSILFRHMTADTQRSQAMESGLALRFSPGVTEDGVVTTEHDVGNDLLETRVVLNLRPGPVLHQLRHEQGSEITLGVGREALEPAEAVELGTRNH